MSGQPEPGHPLTVGTYLRDWLELQRTRLQPSTVASYAGNVRRYLEPHLGDVPLHELDILQLERLWVQLLSFGGEDGRPLSRRTVEYAAATLRSALSDAVRTDLVERNVAKLARLPTIDPDQDDSAGGELQVWTAEEARRFLQETHEDGLHDIWAVALGTGMRRGELLGLRWEDVDLDARILHVRRALQVVDGHARLKATKTLRSRSIRIDVNVVEVLRRRRRQQQLQREAAGEHGWRDRWGLAFTEEDGTYLVPMNVTQAFRWRVRRVDVPTIRLHDLRHTHATLLLEAGVPIKVVSERLGHASVSMTLDVYAHVLPAMEVDAVERFTAHLYGE